MLEARRASSEHRRERLNETNGSISSLRVSFTSLHSLQFPAPTAPSSSRLLFVSCALFPYTPLPSSHHTPHNCHDTSFQLTSWLLPSFPKLMARSDSSFSAIFIIIVISSVLLCLLIPPVAATPGECLVVWNQFMNAVRPAFLSLPLNLLHVMCKSVCIRSFRFISSTACDVLKELPAASSGNK